MATSIPDRTPVVDVTGDLPALLAFGTLALLVGSGIVYTIRWSRDREKRCRRTARRHGFEFESRCEELAREEGLALLDPFVPRPRRSFVNTWHRDEPEGDGFVFDYYSSRPGDFGSGPMFHGTFFALRIAAASLPRFSIVPRPVLWEELELPRASTSFCRRYAVRGAREAGRWVAADAVRDLLEPPVLDAFVETGHHRWSVDGGGRWLSLRRQKGEGVVRRIEAEPGSEIPDLYREAIEIARLFVPASPEPGSERRVE